MLQFNRRSRERHQNLSFSCAPDSANPNFTTATYPDTTQGWHHAEVIREPIESLETDAVPQLQQSRRLKNLNFCAPSPANSRPDVKSFKTTGGRLPIDWVGPTVVLADIAFILACSVFVEFLYDLSISGAARTLAEVGTSNSFASALIGMLFLM